MASVQTKIEIYWHYQDAYTAVAKVHGGWIVKNLEDDYQLNNQGQGVCTNGFRHALVFVPDPNHEWEMETLIGVHK